MARILGVDIDEHTIRATFVRSSMRKTEVLAYLEAPIVQGMVALETAEPEADPTAGLYPEPAPVLEEAFDVLPNEAEAEAALPEGVDVALADANDDASPEENDSEDTPAETPMVFTSPRDEAVRRALAEILSQLRPGPEQFIAGLDGREASLRILELPAIAAKKKRIAEVLPAEIDDLLPFDIDNLVLDHQLIDDPKGKAMIRVMATAVPREKIAERISELGRAGISPRQLAVGAAALDGLIPLVPALQESGSPKLILEVEGPNAEFCVVEDGRCTFARSVSLGAEAFRSETQRAAFAGLLRRTIAGYRSGGNDAIEAVYLCGEGVADGNELRPWLGEIFGAPVEDLPLPDAPGGDPMLRARHGRSAALACRTASKEKRLNLRIGEFAPAEDGSFFRTHGKLLGICAGVLLGAFAFSSYARYSVLSSEQEALQAELASVTDELFDEETTSVSRAQSLIEGGRAEVDPLPAFTAFDALDRISHAIPEDIEHTTRRLVIEMNDETREGRLEIQGSLATISERDTIASNLEETECFNEVDPGPTSPGPGNEGLNYRLELTIHCPGDEPLVSERESRRNRRGRNR